MELVGVAWGCPGHAVLKELLRWTSKWSPAAANELGPTPSSKVVLSIPTPPQIYADLDGVLPYASTPTLANNVLHLTYVVWAQDKAKVRCRELVTTQPHLWTYPNLEQFVNSRLQGEELPPVENSTTVVLPGTFPFIEESAQLAHQRN